MKAEMLLHVRSEVPPQNYLDSHPKRDAYQVETKLNGDHHTIQGEVLPTVAWSRAQGCKLRR